MRPGEKGHTNRQAESSSDSQKRESKLYLVVIDEKARKDYRKDIIVEGFFRSPAYRQVRRKKLVV